MKYLMISLFLFQSALSFAQTPKITSGAAEVLCQGKFTEGAQVRLIIFNDLYSGRRDAQFIIRNGSDRINGGASDLKRRIEIQKKKDVIKYSSENFTLWVELFTNQGQDTFEGFQYQAQLRKIKGENVAGDLRIGCDVFFKIHGKSLR